MDVLFNLIVNFVGWCLVISGWHRVSKENKESHNRQELRQALNKLDSDLNNLNEIASDYFCKVKNTSDDAIREEVRIKRIIDLLHTKVAQLDKAFDDSRQKLTKYCDYITAHNKFENKSFKGTLKYNDESLLIMHLFLKEVLESLEETFHLIHK